MKVQFFRLHRELRRVRRRGGLTLDGPYAAALVDGQHMVRCSQEHGWSCDCGDDECGHVDAVADLIHPNVLAALESDPTNGEPTS